MYSKGEGVLQDNATNSRDKGITSKDWNATFRMRVLRDLDQNPSPDARLSHEHRPA